jgi:hypothetical protein
MEWNTGTDVLAILVLVPTPPHCVLYTEFDAHIAFMVSTQKVLFVFWSNVSVGMERFGVHFDKIGHTNNPMLW